MDNRNFEDKLIAVGLFMLSISSVVLAINILIIAIVSVKSMIGV